MDSMNIWGRTRDVVMVGKGKSTLDTVVASVAAAQGGRVVKPDLHPDKGFFYRSDQFNFAKKGVPAVYLDAGADFVGPDAARERALQDKHEAAHYHQPSDELRPEWNLQGAVEDAQLLFYVGVKVANGARMPSWNPGDEFEAARKQAIAEAR
jgi:Zn-dependent M28 family amino/carboxypeptidase